MARILFGPMVADARGKQGGIVFSRNASGHYIRSKVSPIQPRTTDQLAVRASMTEEAQAWSKILTDAQRASWTSYAQATPLTDRFGNKVALSGIAMFLRYNVQWTRSGGTRVTTAPSTPGEAYMTAWTLTGTVSGGLEVTAPSPALAVGERLMLYVGLTYTSAARQFYNGPWRYVDHMLSTDTPPFEITPPFALAAGQRVWVLSRLFDAAGRVGPTFKAYVDVTAGT